MVTQAQAQYSGGTGEPNDPYQIATAADLIALGETPEDYDKHFVLTVDIDLEPNLPGRKVFDKAVIAPDTNQDDGISWFASTTFTGVLDGNGQTISHLTITGRDWLGLIGYLGPGRRRGAGGEVKDLGLVEARIMGSGSCIGGLVGYNNGSLRACYNTGSVSGIDCVGGLMGNTGAPYVGVNQSFWDTQTSGRSKSAGGTGKTTAEMQTASTFLNAGWDFVGETANGTDDIWWIDEGKDYPRLWWEN